MADGISELAKLYSATQPIEPTLDFPVATSPLIPSTDFSNPLSALSLQLQEKARQLEDQKSQYERDALAASSLSGPEAITGSALAALPILVGLALKGKKGGAIGAQAGGLGSLNFFGNLQKEDEKKRLLAQAQLKQVQNQQADLTKQAFQLQTKGAEIKSRENQGELNRQNQKSIAEIRAGAKDILAKGDLPPLVVEALKKIKDGEELSSEQFTALASNEKTMKLANQTENAFGVGNRFEAKRELEFARGAIPGSVLAKGYKPPNSSVVEKVLIPKQAARDQINYIYDQMADIISKVGAGKLTDVEAAQLQQLSSQAFETFRKLGGAGARLEGREEANILANLPNTLSGKGLTEYLRGKILNRDPIKFAEKAKDYWKTAGALELANYGILIPEFKYPEGFLESKKLQFPEAEQSSPIIANMKIIKNGQTMTAYRHADGTVRDEAGNIME